MTYRGDDLDLRTHRAYPQHRSDADGDEEGGNGAGTLERYAPSRRPIWVDDVVLACCNQAYDAAMAYRAPEVRIEHLLNAMTKVEGAAEVLEARGARVFNLRRETAAIIAHDIPTVPKDAPLNPRRSDELEETLRRAAAQAFRHGVSPDGDTATIDDIVDVLLEARFDIPSVAMLGRSQPRLGREYAQMRRAYAFDGDAPFPAAGRLSRGRHALSYADDGGSAPPRREIANQGDGGAGAAWGQILERLHAVEHALSELKSASSSQPKLVETAVGRIAGAVQATANDAAGFWSDVSQSLKGIERRLESRSPGMDGLAPINDKLAIIEEAVLTPVAGGEGVRFENFRDMLEAHTATALASVDAVRTDVAKLSQAVARTAEVAGQAARSNDMAALPSRLVAAIAESTERQGGPVLAAFDGRMAGLRDALGERWTAASAELSARHDQKLTALETALSGALRLLEGKQKNVAVAIEHFGKASGECLDHIDARLERLETANARIAALVEDAHRLALEKSRRRNRFWRWLFGVDDWVAASWPKATSRIDAEMGARTARS